MKIARWSHTILNPSTWEGKQIQAYLCEFEVRFIYITSSRSVRPIYKSVFKREKNVIRNIKKQDKPILKERKFSLSIPTHNARVMSIINKK